MWTILTPWRAEILATNITIVSLTRKRNWFMSSYNLWKISYKQFFFFHRNLFKIIFKYLLNTFSRLLWLLVQKTQVFVSKQTLDWKLDFVALEVDGCFEAEEEEKRPSNMNPILGEIPKTNPPNRNIKREIISFFWQFFCLLLEGTEMWMMLDGPIR